MENQIYSNFLKKHTEKFNELTRKVRAVSIARLLSVLGITALIYFYIQTKEISLLVLAGLVLILFGFLVRYFSILSRQKKFQNALMEINGNEIEFLEKKELRFEDGREYSDPSHPYSHDLDFFGPRSLFQVLNRTETYIGKQSLAENLVTLMSEKEILESQKATKELAEDIEWRQDVSAQARLTSDNHEVFQNLNRWTKTEIQVIPTIYVIAAYVLPVLLIGATIYNFVFDAGIGFKCFYLFLFNIGLVATNLKKIKSEIIQSTKIDRTLNNYSLILKKIEQKQFGSSKLIELQNRSGNSENSASSEIKKLSDLFGQLDNIQNPFGAALVNGFFLYHLHTMRGFAKWKQKNAKQIIDWIKVIGKFESLNSIANFSYNNPRFVYPKLNSEHVIRFEGLGHPLLDANQRVTSDVSFEKENFIILTGSNMSGKSTFLRSLGVNMVLGGIGAPVCASKAEMHPIPVYVSMRVSDSLNDNESFFFAEVKRLKAVMDAADTEISFVLLDEILRGTNSDDKRTGTVEVVKKILSKNAIGALATHDLKVCDTTKEYPNQLTNKCFEVEIVDNDLFFDYKLREGVCKNKSATFLMEKMKVI